MERTSYWQPHLRVNDQVGLERELLYVPARLDRSCKVQASRQLVQLLIVVLRSFERGWAEVATRVLFDKDARPENSQSKSG